MAAAIRILCRYRPPSYHDTGLGPLLIPAAAFGVLVIGPLRKHPVFALVLCVLFAVIDESLQNFMPGRTGSVTDVIIDTSGAVSAYVAYLAIINLLKTRNYPLHSRKADQALRHRHTEIQRSTGYSSICFEAHDIDCSPTNLNQSTPDPRVLARLHSRTSKRLAGHAKRQVQRDR